MDRSTLQDELPFMREQLIPSSVTESTDGGHVIIGTYDIDGPEAVSDDEIGDNEARKYLLGKGLSAAAIELALPMIREQAKLLRCGANESRISKMRAGSGAPIAKLARHDSTAPLISSAVSEYPYRYNSKADFEERAYDWAERAAGEAVRPPFDDRA